MSAELLAGRLLSAMAKPAAHLLWHQVAGDPVTSELGRAASRALARAVYAVASDIDADAAHVELLAELLASALDLPELLELALTRPVRDGVPLDPETLIDAVVRQFRLRGGDTTSSALPIASVLRTFALTLPEELRVAAATPGSALTNFEVVAALTQVTALLAPKQSPAPFAIDAEQYRRYLKTLVGTSLALPDYFPRLLRERSRSRDIAQPSWVSVEPWRLILTQSESVTLKSNDQRFDPEARDSEDLHEWPQLWARSRHVVVLADPGVGKSWLLRRTISAVAEGALEATGTGTLTEQYRADVLARLLIREPDAGSAIADHLHRHEPNLGSVDSLKSRLLEGPVVLGVDALDEVGTQEAKDRIYVGLAELAKLNPQLRIVATSRYAGYVRPTWLETETGDLEVHLLGFTRESAERFVSAWAQGDERLLSRLMRAVARPEMRSLAQVPLLLSFICLVEGSGSSPDTLHELLDVFLRRIIEGPWRDPSRRITEVTAVEAALRDASLIARYVATSSGSWRDVFTAEDCLNALGNADPERVHAQVSRYGLITPVTVLATKGDETLLMFLHRVLQEHLVARSLVTHPLDTLPEVLAPRWAIDPTWDKTLILAVSRSARSQAIQALPSDTLESVELALRCISELEPGRAMDSRLELAVNAYVDRAEKLNPIARSAIRWRLLADGAKLLTLTSPADDLSSHDYHKLLLLADSGGQNAVAAWTQVLRGLSDAPRRFARLSAYAERMPVESLSELVDALGPPDTRSAHLHMISALLNGESPSAIAARLGQLLAPGAISVLVRTEQRPIWSRDLYVDLFGGLRGDREPEVLLWFALNSTDRSAHYALTDLIASSESSRRVELAGQVRDFARGRSVREEAVRLLAKSPTPPTNLWKVLSPTEVAQALWELLALGEVHIPADAQPYVFGALVGVVRHEDVVTAARALCCLASISDDVWAALDVREPGVRRALQLAAWLLVSLEDEDAGRRTLEKLAHAPIADAYAICALAAADPANSPTPRSVQRLMADVLATGSWAKEPGRMEVATALASSAPAKWRERRIRSAQISLQKSLAIGEHVSELLESFLGCLGRDEDDVEDIVAAVGAARSVLSEIVAEHSGAERLAVATEVRQLLSHTVQLEHALSGKLGVDATITAQYAHVGELLTIKRHYARGVITRSEFQTELEEIFTHPSALRRSGY